MSTIVTVLTKPNGKMDLVTNLSEAEVLNLLLGPSVDTPLKSGYAKMPGIPDDKNETENLFINRADIGLIIIAVQKPATPKGNIIIPRAEPSPEVKRNLGLT